MSPTSPTGPPRVGVLIPDMQPAAWIAHAVEDLVRVASVTQVLIGPASPLPGRPTTLDQPRRIHWPSEAPATMDVDQVAGDEPGLDILICLGVQHLEDLDVAARWGVWGLSVDREPRRAYDATVAGDETVALWLASWSSPGKRLRPSAVRVHRLSPATTRRRLLARAARLPARALGDLVRGEAPSITPDSLPVQPQRWAWPRLAARAAGTGLRRVLHKNGWYLGVEIDPGANGVDAASLHSIHPPAGHFWADPFPVVLSPERGLIYVEEWADDLGRGRLAVLEIDRHGHWQRLGTVMEEPIHLSHPFLFSWEGQRYMIPETSARQTVELYRQEGENPLDWRLHEVWMEGQRVVDVTVQPIADRWWLFANVADDGTSAHDELHAFWAESPLGPWQPHAANPVVSDPGRARPAGLLFEQDGQLIRPGQDCGARYGRAIVLCEIEELSPERYVERVVGRMEPAPYGANRLHTLNTDGWLRVIDLHQDRRRWR